MNWAELFYLVNFNKKILMRISWLMVVNVVLELRVLSFERWVDQLFLNETIF